MSRPRMPALLLAALILLPASPAGAEMETSLRGLARRMMAKAPKGIRVGVVAFTAGGKADSKKSSILGLNIAEVLSTELAGMAGGRFTVVERLHLVKLLKDAEFFEQGNDYTDSLLKGAKVGALLTGSYIASKGSVLVTAKLISTRDGTLLAGGTARFPREGAVEGMLAREFPVARGRPVRVSSGSSAAHLVDVGVFYEAPNGRLYPVREGMALYPRDNYAVYFKPRRRAYVYIFQVDTASQVTRLFPNPELFRTATNPREAGQATWAPGPGRFFFLDQTKGREEIFLFASPEPIPALEGKAPSAASLARPLKLMGVGGVRKSAATVEVRSAGGDLISYETVRAQVSERGLLAFRLWFWHR